MTNQEDPNEPTGYKRPPRSSQFKPGQSGNPKGRPKGRKNFDTLLEQELKAPVLITENEKRRKITKQEAIVKQLVNKAAGGDPKAIPILLNEMRIAKDAAQNEKGNRDPEISPDDAAILAHYLNKDKT